MKNHRPPY